MNCAAGASNRQALHLALPSKVQHQILMHLSDLIRQRLVAAANAIANDNTCGVVDGLIK